jgi:hypothetical protein
MHFKYNPLIPQHLDQSGLSLYTADLRYLKLDQTTPQTTIGLFLLDADRWDGQHYPLSALGDIIYGGAGGIATRLGIGALNTLLHGGATPSWSAVVEADLSLSNNTTANVSAATHGFAPKLPSSAIQFLDGTGNWSTPSASSTNDYSITTFTGQTSVNVVHNFHTYPLVQVILTATGAVEIPYTITHNSTDDFTVTFTSATDGSILATVGSPQPMGYKTVNNDYGVLTTDRIINVSASGKTITLYTAVGHTGREIIIDNSSGGNITVVPQAGQTIEGETSQTMPDSSAMNMFSTGSVWRIY